MKRTWAVHAVIFAGLLGGCNTRQSQEQQLSPAVKAAVVAALGSHVTDADLTEFLRSAKLASRTKHDAEVVALLDEAVSLLRSAAQDDYQAEDSRREGRHKTDLLTLCNTAKDDYTVKFCQQAEVARDVNKERDRVQRSLEVAQSYENESEKKKAKAADLVQKLLVELQ